MNVKEPRRCLFSEFLSAGKLPVVQFRQLKKPSFIHKKEGKLQQAGRRTGREAGETLPIRWECCCRLVSEGQTTKKV